MHAALFFAENLRFVLLCGMMKKMKKEKAKSENNKQRQKTRQKNKEKRKADGIWEKMQIRKHTDITAPKGR